MLRARERGLRRRKRGTKPKELERAINILNELADQLCFRDLEGPRVTISNRYAEITISYEFRMGDYFIIVQPWLKYPGSERLYLTGVTAHFTRFQEYRPCQSKRITYGRAAFTPSGLITAQPMKLSFSMPEKK